MEPRIQYARTKDGVSIAYWTLGEGEPVVDMWPNLFSNIQLEWEAPVWRRWYEGLAEKRKLIRYDCRGGGMSERDVADFSLDTHVLDLEAVVNHLGLERFALLVVAEGGPVGLTYASRHPERVSRLILWCSWPRAADLSTSIHYQALGTLRDTDWEMFTETMAHVALGWSEGEEARRFAATMRESVSRETLQAFERGEEGTDATELLPQVKSPTLVLHRRGVPFPDVEIAKRLASQIPEARLALLEGTSLGPYLEDTDAVLRAIDEFLSEGDEAEPAKSAAGSGFATILFTDIESSTAHTQRLGDAKAQELVREHNTIVRTALGEHGGSEIKHTGDGIMASFTTASGALECAIAIQQAVESQEHSPLRVRIGLNAGEPVAEEDDLFGTAVQLARRICDRAGGGEILASDVVRQLAAGKGFLFSDRGETELRGFEDPVRLYEVRWREEA